MREPDTPGGFRDSMPCKAVSNSATAEDMAKMADELLSNAIGSINTAGTEGKAIESALGSLLYAPRALHQDPR